MLPDGSQYAVQFNGRLNNFSLNSYTFMAGWCAQKISGFARWQAVDSSAAPPSTAVPISDNFKGPRTFNIWSSTGWAVGLAGQGFSISTTSGKRGISGSLLIDIPYLKWHLWLQSTWMEYERFQEIGDHEKTRWWKVTSWEWWIPVLHGIQMRKQSSSRPGVWNPLHLVDVLAIWWVPTANPNLPVIHGNVSVQA